MRWIVLSLCCLVAAGCCNTTQVPTQNPFNTYTTIAPPATGSNSPGFSQPLYAQNVTTPQHMTARGQGAASNSMIVPPPGTGSWGNTAPGTATLHSQSANMIQPKSDSTIGNQGTIYETIQPRSLRMKQDASGNWTTVGPTRNTPHTNGKAVDISDLPPADTEANWSSRPQPDRPTTQSPHSAHYAHAEDYSWLRGELQYSQIDRCWKLRYMRCDEGSCDRYGGSVILPDKAILSGLERGEIVEVRGRLGEIDPNIGGFAPVYHVSQIRQASS